MSKLSQDSRKAMKAKAERLAADPHQKVDSSTWTPPEDIGAGVKTGARPLVKRLYKSGGKVKGADAKKRADRAMRKSGGRTTEAADRSKRYLTPDNLINRDVRMANEDREGRKLTGGFKRGGRAKHATKGGVDERTQYQMDKARSGIDPYADESFSDSAATARALGVTGKAKSSRPASSSVPLPPRRPMDLDGVPTPPIRPSGLKKGGKAGHPDVAEDKALIKKMVKPSAMRDANCYGGKTKKADGGKVKWIQKAIKHPGSLHKALHVAEGEKIPAKKLEKAEHSKNPKLAKKAHLAETLKRMHHAKGGEVFSGNSKEKIPGVVGGRIAHKHGGKTKGKTHININVMPGHAGAPPAGNPMAALAPLLAGAGAGGPPMPPPMPPRPQGMPPMGAGGPQIPPAFGGGAPMGRKTGGRVGKFVGGSMGMPGNSGDMPYWDAASNQYIPMRMLMQQDPQKYHQVMNQMSQSNPPDVRGPERGGDMGRAMGPARDSGVGGHEGQTMYKRGGKVKAGGRTEHVIDHAAGGGLGRLEKIKAYGEAQKGLK